MRASNTCSNASIQALTCLSRSGSVFLAVTFVAACFFSQFYLKSPPATYAFAGFAAYSFLLSASFLLQKNHKNLPIAPLLPPPLLPVQMLKPKTEAKKLSSSDFSALQKEVITLKEPIIYERINQAMRFGYIDLIEFYAPHVSIESRTTLLEKAFLKDMPTAIECLVKHGANINSLDPKTKLTYLQRSLLPDPPSLAMIEALLKLVPSEKVVEIHPSMGFTAIHIAASKVHPLQFQVIELLIKAYPDCVNFLNQCNKTPLEVYIKTNESSREDIANLLMPTDADLLKEVTPFLIEWGFEVVSIP